MKQVFISYARANEAVAKRVESGLKASGFEAWRDDQLPAHRAYSEIIEQRLRGASAVVVLWSKEAAQSQWVRAEADFARTEGKLVQAQLDDTLPPLPFNQIQCADLSSWRGNRKHRGWAKLVESVTSVASGERPKTAEPATSAGRGPVNRRLAIAALALLVLAAGALFLLLPRLAGGPEEAPKVAVLPFESVAGSDEGLVEGIWEDTRQALSRNPQLIVLGPNTSEEIAKKGSGAARKAADYLVEASVRTAGNQVRVSTSLVRSSDGAQVWSQTFDRKLDDVFALQAEIAQQIEGRIRGRLARGGGVLPEHITTSGEVYALYSDARATIRKREAQRYKEAVEQLEKVVATDPNFAPGWATLSVAHYLNQPTMLHGGSTGHEPETYARRAITLAPNLAAGHAALGLALGRRGPVAEAALRRAVQLDPSDVESLNWMASVELSRDRWREAQRLYDRAIQVEPLWWPAVLNRLILLHETNQAAAIDAELGRLDELGNPRLAALARMEVLDARGDYSEAVKLGLDYLRRPDADRAGIDDRLASFLLRLGHIDLGWQLSNAPPTAPVMWRNDPRGLDMFETRNIPPPVFWKISPVSEVVSRSYVTMGRGEGLLRLYRAASSSPEDFLNLVNDPVRFLYLVPILAAAFEGAGETAEAKRLLDAADTVLTRSSTIGINRRDEAILTARLRAMQGRRDEAIAEMRKAMQHGWLPWAPLYKPDLRDDPAFKPLGGMPEFEEMRSRILAHLAKEREELGPVSLDGVRTAGPPR